MFFKTACDQHISYVQDQGKYWKYLVRPTETKPVSNSYLWGILFK